MASPELIFVTGSNAAGKSSLIRSHLSEFPDHEVIMTDVYKGRSRQVFSDAVKARKSIILETPFNDEGFKDLIDHAKTAGYHCTFIVLFLKSPAQSFERVAARRAFEGGLVISSGNVEFNFIENFRNVSKYFPYFNESYFLYTGEIGRNELIMRFEKDKLMEYVSNDLTFVQKFAEQAYKLERLDKHDLEIIAANKNHKTESHQISHSKGFRMS
jgi:predicted ABC-type ATPase